MNAGHVLVIGGGVAGLCAGIYLRRLGFDVEILEQHALAGGLATAWRRNGFTFENCIHWLVGSKDGGPLNATWKEVIDINRLEFFEDSVFEVLERGEERLTLYRDPNRLEAELLDKAPQDATAIRAFVGLVRKIARLRMPEGDSLIRNLRAGLDLVPLLPRLARYGKLTMAAFSNRFTHPLLRAFFSAGIGELSLLAIVFSLAWMAQRNAGYPVGGSLALVRLLEEGFRRQGGLLRLNTRVERILVENGCAAGVTLQGGETRRADVIVSAADGHATVFDMLQGRFVDDRIRKIYETFRPFPSYLQVSFGVGADLKGEPGTIVLFPDQGIRLDPDTTAAALTFRLFHFDPTMAPPGKTAIACFLPTYNNSYWSELRKKDSALYTAEKQRVAASVAAVFEARFAKARGRIEVVDVATPATVVRYTGNWRGSMEGWLYTPATGIRPLPCVLPGLRNFYMVGQWTSPGGGLPSGLLTARSVSKRMAKEHGVRWILT